MKTRTPDSDIIRLLNAGNIVAIKSFSNDKDRNACYILFSDEKTVLQLDEQDYYSYHDCSSLARILSVYENPELWTSIISDPNFEDALCLY